MRIDDATADLMAQYLDGTLTGATLSAFEQRLRDDPALRAEVVSMQGIDAALQRSFTGSAITGAQILTMANAIAPRSVVWSANSTSQTVGRALHTGSSPLRRLGVAAALLGGLFGLWMVWEQVKPDPTARLIVGPQQPKNAAAYYNTKVADGYHPDWVCDSDAQFATTFRERFGQALVLKPAADGTRMLGLDYAPVLSPLTIGVLGEADGKPILVLIDRLADDNRAAVYTDCVNLRVFRRELGTLVMYEISPLSKSRMLDLLTPTEGK